MWPRDASESIVSKRPLPADEAEVIERHESRARGTCHVVEAWRSPSAVRAAAPAWVSAQVPLGWPPPAANADGPRPAVVPTHRSVSPHVVRMRRAIARSRPWHLSIMAIVAATSIVATASLVVHGRVTLDYLLTGIVASLVVSYAINSIVYAYLDELEERVQARTAELAATNAALRAESETRLQYAMDLAVAKEAVEVANQVKTEFLANLSHELRTPLNMVIGMTEMLLESGLRAEEQRWAKTVCDSAQELLGLIVDVLNVANFDSIHDYPVVEAEPRSILSFALRPIRERATAKGLALACSVDDAVPTQAWIAEGPIRQVLSRLLGNALKFSQRGTITLRVAVAGVPDQERLRFEVQDEGVGVPVAAQAHIFEPFVQADGSTTRRHGGAGVGLAIARRLVDAMHGEIGMSSVPGAGSTFWFEAPLRRSTLTVTDRHDPGAPGGRTP